MKKLLYTLLMILGLSVHAQDTNYIGPVDAHNTTWSNFYILDTERFFLNGQEIFGSTSGVFQLSVNGSNFYGTIFLTGGVSIANSSTLVFSASTFTQAFSVAYSGSATNPIDVALGASNTIFVSNGTNSTPSFATIGSLGLATGTPSYVDLGATGFVGDARLSLSYDPSTRIATGSVSVAGLATGTPLYVENDPTWTAASNTYWSIAGNANTTNGTHFIGTTDNQAFDVRVANSRVMFISTDAPPNIIMGSASNSIDSTLDASVSSLRTVGGVIGGGGTNSIGVSSKYGVIAGGTRNRIDSNSYESAIGGGNGNYIGGSFSAGQYSRNSVIGGGLNNIITNASYNATISGGAANRIDGSGEGTISGGDGNHLVGSLQSIISGGIGCKMYSSTASFMGGGQGNIMNTGSTYSVLLGGSSCNMLPYSYQCGLLSGVSITMGNSTGSVIVGGAYNVSTNTSYTSLGGGFSNKVVGTGSVVPGGRFNSALSDNSFAAGQSALAAHNNSFVWSDGINVNASSARTNTFNIYAAGGFLINSQEVFDGSGNILLARITNAANGVYATGTPLYVETDNTILSNSTVVGSASKFNFVNPSALTIAGGTANVTMATSGSAAGNFTNHQPILEWYAPRDNTTNNNMLVSSAPATNYLSTYTATSIEECIMFWQTAATTSQDRQRAFSISMPVAFGTTTTNIQIKMRHNQSTNGIFVTQFFYNNESIAFTNQITAANSTETKNMATAGTFLTNLPEGLKLYGNIIGTSQSTNTANQAQLGLMDFRIMR